MVSIMLGINVVSDYQPKNRSFKGNPERLYYGLIKDYQDALFVWERLKSAKYLDVHSDKLSPFNKKIRAMNYSFLDQLTSVFDKSQFIQAFCEFTKFPNLGMISQNIDATFQRCLAQLSRSLNSTCYSAKPYNIIDSGYDTTCSLGLKKAFPGSDLDKGYIIIEGNHPCYSDETIVNEFKGGLWNNLDQRIVSLNHPETYPDVYTRNQVLSMLSKMDFATSILMVKELLKKKPLFWGLFGSTNKYPDSIKSNETDPYNAAILNRDLAMTLPTSEREGAKNFAFFIETVLSNLRKYPAGKVDELFTKIKTSVFAQKSNVTQNSAWQRRINNGYLKTKLRRREQLERDFALMDVNEKYELIKDIIKSSSNDQTSRFAQFFTNDDDISGRYERLLNSLR